MRLCERLWLSSRAKVHWALTSRSNGPRRPTVIGAAISYIPTAAAYGLPDLADQLPLHTVWTDPEPGATRYDAVALGSDWYGPAAAARRDAVRYIYIEPGTPMPIELFPFQSDTELTRIDLEATGRPLEAEDAT